MCEEHRQRPVIWNCAKCHSIRFAGPIDLLEHSQYHIEQRLKPIVVALCNTFLPKVVPLRQQEPDIETEGDGATLAIRSLNNRRRPVVVHCQWRFLRVEVTVRADRLA